MVTSFPPTSIVPINISFPSGFGIFLIFLSSFSNLVTSSKFNIISVRPADLIEPQLPELREEIKDYAKSDEDLLMYALFPQQAKDYLGRREDPYYDVPVQTVEVSLDLQ